MRDYIKDLTSSLIGSRIYGSLVAGQSLSRKQMLKIIRRDLEDGPIREMRPETLGKIFCSFDREDISRPGFMYEIVSSVDYDDMLRKLVALALAYIIVDRLNPGKDERYANRSNYDRGRLALIDHLIDMNLQMALYREKRGEDIGDQLKIITENYALRRRILAG